MIYGASKTFDVIRKNFDISKLNIIGVADIRFNDGEEYEGFKTCNSYTFFEEKPDVVLIAMLESEVADYFFEDALVPKYGDFKYEPLKKLSFLNRLKTFFLLYM